MHTTSEPSMPLSFPDDLPEGAAYVIVAAGVGIVFVVAPLGLLQGPRAIPAPPRRRPSSPIRRHSTTSASRRRHSMPHYRRSRRPAARFPSRVGRWREVVAS